MYISDDQSKKQIKSLIASWPHEKCKLNGPLLVICNMYIYLNFVIDFLQPLSFSVISLQDDIMKN